jgi:hypothetical protein
MTNTILEINVVIICASEVWTMLENKMQRKIVRSNKEEITRKYRKIYNEWIHNF